MLLKYNGQNVGIINVGIVSIIASLAATSHLQARAGGRTDAQSKLLIFMINVSIIFVFFFISLSLVNGIETPYQCAIHVVEG